MSQRVVVIVQARMGSSRLPGKSLRVLAGRPLIDHVMQRAAAIKHVDRVLLATSANERDSLLAEHVGQLGFTVFRGSELDVLRRYTDAARESQAEVVMRLTGDCPFLAPEVADEVLSVYFTSPLEVSYASNDTTCSGYPDGTDVEVFSRHLLEYSNEHASAAVDREHVTRFMRNRVTTATLKSDTDWSRWKLSVDRPEDYELATRIAARLPADDLSLAATIRAVEELSHENV